MNMIAASWQDFRTSEQKALTVMASSWQEAANNYWPNCPTFSFTLFRSPALNAHAMRWPDTSNCEIGINEGLLLFARGMADLASRHFPFSDDLHRRVASDDATSAQFAALLSQLAGFRIVEPIPRPASEDERAAFARVAELMTIGQVIGHEIAHLGLGHLDPDYTSAWRDFSYFNASETDEIAADINGLILLLLWSAADDVRPALVLWAADFLLASLSFWAKLERDLLWPIANTLQQSAVEQGMEMIFAPRGEARRTHPDYERRRQLLWLGLDEVLGGASDEKSDLNVARAMSAASDEFIASLWVAAKEPFSQAVSRALTSKPG